MSLFCLVLVIIGIGSIKGLYRWSYNIKTGTIPIFITITNPRCTELRLLYRQAEIFFSSAGDTMNCRRYLDAILVGDATTIWPL